MPAFAVAVPNPSKSCAIPEPENGLEMHPISLISSKSKKILEIFRQSQNPSFCLSENLGSIVYVSGQKTISTMICFYLS
jgi:hypothetical protein